MGRELGRRELRGTRQIGASGASLTMATSWLRSTRAFSLCGSPAVSLAAVASRSGAGPSGATIEPARRVSLSRSLA
ncbi:MAG: hypothetical protein R3C10_18100 [Pirellulales bacterium]